MGSDVNQGLGPDWLVSSAVDGARLTWWWAKRWNLISRTTGLRLPCGCCIVAASACQHINTHELSLG